MVFLFWTRPSLQDQKACIDKSGPFNYDFKHHGLSSDLFSSIQQNQDLSKDGFFINHARILLGSGQNTYEKGKTAIQTWKHFGLKWAFVDPKTKIEKGTKFCVCLKEILPWVVLPLQVAYVRDNSRVAHVSDNSRESKLKASFGFGSGTLQGHLLAGEERFSIEWDENNQVWYEILSFSKPAHFLSFIGYPYVLLSQKYFAHQSMQSVRKHVTAQQPKM
ncbi:outer envelope protein isoform X1 [Tasmannia lanceolata]|uniref:outer envelope protein isoform X1 n=1 Tax=Tasmannia lanceolata TaxID=3420 RepID=UPI004064BFE1